MRKKIASYVQVAEDYLTEEHGVIEFAILNIVSNLKKATPKGWVPLTPIKYNSGYTGDDFIHNMITVTGQRFIVRAPRIVSRKYHKNKLP